MRILLPMLFLTGCGVMPGIEVEVERDGATGQITSFELDRNWQAGPVEALAKAPDGTVVYWRSDVELDPAVTAEQIRATKLDAALSRLESILERVGTAAAIGAVP